MITSIEYSKPYELRLLPLYGGTTIKCFIIGETNIDNVTNNQDEYNIYNTYFAPYGYGLGSYYTAITSQTKIYICSEISSFEPLTVEKEKKIFIPATLIDMDNSHEYVECTNINFTIFPMIKHFSSENNQSEYLETITEKMKKKLGELIDFSILTTEIQNTTSPIYLTKEEIDDIENRRAKMFNDNISRQKSVIEFNNEKNRQFEIKNSELRQKIEEYTKKENELKLTKIKLEDTIREYEQLIRDLQNS